MQTIIHVVHMHASPTQVYDALTTAEGLSQWWTTQVTVEAGTGGIIRFTFQGDFHPQMQQTALEPHRLVQWTGCRSEIDAHQAALRGWKGKTLSTGVTSVR